MKKISRPAFKAAHDEGLNRLQLAARFGISPGVVTKIRNELGLPLDQPYRPPSRPSARKIDRDTVKALIEQGETNAEIAARFNCHADSVTRIRTELGLTHPKLGRPMTETRLHAIWQMLFDGWSHEEIHRTEGADVTSIRRYFPGTAWTPEQVGEHARILRTVNNHFNRRPRTYNHDKYAKAAA